jgi:hypothetical protein
MYTAAKLYYANCKTLLLRPYTNQEYADMHSVYYFSNSNATSPVAEYQKWLSGSGVPTKCTFMAIHRHLLETGLFPAKF